MSRYLGSTWKISRRLGFSVEETGREIAKRNFAPGQHGAGRKRKISEYGKQLREKQKVRFMYGVNERQLRRIFGLAVKNKKIVTGYGLLILLESRVDNLCYRLGFARTRNGARQLVNHGHVLVNGKKVDIPSYICNPGDVITLTESAKGFKAVTESLSLIHGKCPYAEFDSAKFEGKFVRVPERAELNQEITESLIVEFYNHLI